MILYFAGNITDKREKLFMKLIANRLYSYYHHRPEGSFNAEFKLRLKYISKLKKKR